jgi:Tfp pilus assembly PilM family ATPase
VSELKHAISKHYQYWQMHTENEGVTTSEVERVILVGGNAGLKGLPEYLETGLEVPIEIGDVWRNVLTAPDALPPVDHTESLEYATAVGLALRSIARGA